MVRELVENAIKWSARLTSGARCSARRKTPADLPAPPSLELPTASAAERHERQEKNPAMPPPESRRAASPLTTEHKVADDARAAGWSRWVSIFRDVRENPPEHKSAKRCPSSRRKVLFEQEGDALINGGQGAVPGDALAENTGITISTIDVVASEHTHADVPGGSSATPRRSSKARSCRRTASSDRPCPAHRRPRSTAPSPAT